MNLLITRVTLTSCYDTILNDCNWVSTRWKWSLRFYTKSTNINIYKEKEYRRTISPTVQTFPCTQRCSTLVIFVIIGDQTSMLYLRALGKYTYKYAVKGYNIQIVKNTLVESAYWTEICLTLQSQQIGTRFCSVSQHVVLASHVWSLRIQLHYTEQF